MMVGSVVAFLISSAMARRVSTPGYKVDCLIFLMKDCPIANEYMPEVKRLMAQYSPKGVQFEFVFEDSDITPAGTVKFRKDFDLKNPFMMDNNHSLAKRYGATISPTAVVRLMNETYYVGRIDDRYAAVGKRRTVVTHHDLKDALNEYLAGKKIAVPKTQAVGCRLY